MKIIISLILILTSVLSYSQLSIGVENTIRKTNLFPLKNEYPLKYDYVPSISCFNSNQKIDYGIKLGLIHHQITFNQTYRNVWGNPSSYGSQSMTTTTTYSSKLSYNIFSSAAFLRVKFGAKRRLYFSLMFGYESLINQKETDHHYYHKSSNSTTITSGPYQGSSSGSYDSTNTIPFKGVESEKNFIYSNFGFGYIIQLSPKFSINTDASFGFITNQLLFYKANDFTDDYTPENLNGSLFFSLGINYKFGKRKKL